MKNYLYFMRLSAVILLVLLMSKVTDCQTLLNENFNYLAGSSLTSNGWNAHSGAGTNPVMVSSPGLVFTDYLSSDIGFSALLANTGEDVNISFTPVTTGAVYCAFLVKVIAIANGYFFHLSVSTVSSNKGRVFINGTGNSYNFGLSKGLEPGVLTTGTPYTTGVTYMLVLKYLIIAGTINDEVSLFIITGSVPSTEPVVPAIGPLTDSESDLANVSAVALRQYSAAQNIRIDGIRVATNWSDAVGVSTLDNEPALEEEQIIYPIPVEEELTIRNCLNVKTIEICDLTGKKVIISKTGGADMIKISAARLTSGIYFVRLKTSLGIKIVRFIKS
jgi:hypothetical protein